MAKLNEMRLPKSADPLGLFVSLRDAGILGRYSYLHVTADSAEIGWAPAGHLQLLNGTADADWRNKLAGFVAGAEKSDRKAFGYIGFDAADRHIGTLPDMSGTGLPLVEFIIPSETITITPEATVYRGSGSLDLAGHLDASYAKPASTLDATLPPQPCSAIEDTVYMTAVRSGVQAITQGLARKLVLSRYLAFDADYDPADVFASLSPNFVDGFLVSFGDLTAIIPSPELLLSATNRRITTNPLAGTRPRGADPLEDDRLRRELLENHKEIVEHVVSVKTVVGELEGICKPHSVAVSEFMEVVPSSRVQHLSSIVAGELDGGFGVLDALWALFPAVTVAGLPKKQAIEVMRGLEGGPRYLYAGAVGWVQGQDSCRFSLALRGIIRSGRRSFIQAGAGILPESNPQAEWRETAHKLSAITQSLAAADAAARSRKQRREAMAVAPAEDMADRSGRQAAPAVSALMQSRR